MRVGDLQDSAMVGRRVALLDEVTCASSAYLAHRGTPVSIDDLTGHVSIGFVSSASGMALPLEFTVNGDVRKVALPSTVTVTSAETYVAAAKLGLGLIQIPRYHAQADLAAGTLVSVLPDFPPSPTPVSLLYPHSRQLSPRVRVFIDWVTQELAASQKNL